VREKRILNRISPKNKADPQWGSALFSRHCELTSVGEAIPSSFRDCFASLAMTPHSDAVVSLKKLGSAL
jgi:hypothetical protein